MRRFPPIEHVLLAFGAAAASVAVLVWTSAVVSFGLAVTAAICWCIWLEQHPAA